MQDLRSEIRTAFEREQAAHPASSDMSRRIASAVSASRQKPNFQWAAVVAAILIAILAAGGLTWIRFMHSTSQAHPKASVTPLPTATASPTFIEDYGPPPEGVPLVYVQDPKNAAWYIGFDWSGTPRGTIKLSPAIDAQGSLSQSPNGSAFAISPAAKGGFQEFRDRLGQPIPNNAASTRFQDQMWANDSSGLCALDYIPGQPGHWEIGFRSAGGTPAEHQLALDPSVVQSGIIAIGFRSCSPATNRAVLVYNAYGRPTDVYVVRISDGAIVLHQSRPAASLADITASPDSSLIAESSNKSSGYLLNGPAANTVIRRVADGATVATLDPTFGVIAFSQDNAVALVNTSPWVNNLATHLVLVRLSDSSILWRYDGNLSLAAAFAQPAGSNIALMLQDTTTSQTTHEAINLVIVHLDGTATTVPDRYIRP